jgi:hypothetical protein
LASADRRTPPVHSRRTLAALAAAGALCLSAAAVAQQLGAPSQSPPPPGVAEGEGAANPKGGYAALDQLPDWGGIWFLQRSPPDAPRNPKFKGEYLTNWEAWRAEVAANDGVERRDRNNCSPPGLPRIMLLAQYPYEFLFTPGRVTINQEAWMQTRTIWTDGREHPPLEELDPTFHGHSVGHWEGDTLVDENTLENRLTMTDPVAFEEPFEVTATYRRDRYGALIEFQCAENDRNPINAEGETQFH